MSNTTPRMTKTAIIKSTTRYYLNHLRGKSATDSCEYLTGNGSMCAVGRCLNKAALDLNPDGSVDEVWDNEEELDAALKANYRGHSIAFWWDLQSFHDTNAYWKAKDDGGNELTAYGREKQISLLNKYSFQ